MGRFRWYLSRLRSSITVQREYGSGPNGCAEWGQNPNTSHTTLMPRLSPEFFSAPRLRATIPPAAATRTQAPRLIRTMLAPDRRGSLSQSAQLSQSGREWSATLPIRAMFQMLLTEGSCQTSPSLVVSRYCTTDMATPTTTSTITMHGTLFLSRATTIARATRPSHPAGSTREPPGGTAP